MEWFDTNVGSCYTTLKQAPKVLKAVGVNLPVNVLLSMVDNLVSVFLCEAIVGSQCIGIESRSCFHMLLDFGLKSRTLAVGNHGGANLPAPFQRTEHDGLVFSASTSDAALFLV